MCYYGIKKKGKRKARNFHSGSEAPRFVCNWSCDMTKVSRPDQNGKHRAQFEKNKKRIYASQSTCGICGGPVDFRLKYPHPLSPCIDHIIPIAKGGHPSDIENLQLAHWTCNRQKSDRLMQPHDPGEAAEVITNRNLPHSVDWLAFELKLEQQKSGTS